MRYLLVVMLGCSATVASAQKPRVVVTTDPELDDANSLIRYLLYSTDFRTEGLIYASSQFHWKGDGSGKKVSVPNREYSRWGLNLCPCASWRWAPDEHYIDIAVATYAQVYPNLRVHNPNYPTPAELQSKIRWGNVAFDGDISQDTPGSDLIKALLLDDEPGPVYLLAWGGQSTIARALKSIQLQYSGKQEWPAVYQKVSRKAILSPSGDQDDTYATYIHPNWPDIRMLPAGVGGVLLGLRGARQGERRGFDLLQQRLDAGEYLEPWRVRRVVPGVGRWQADGSGRHLRLFRAVGLQRGSAQGTELHRLDAAPRQGRVHR